MPNLLENCYQGRPPRDVDMQEDMLVALVRHDTEKNSGLQSYLRNMLSALSNLRGMVNGIPLFLLLGFTLFVEAVPWTAEFMPWGLTSVIRASRPAMAVSLVLDQLIPTLTPLIATVIGCLVFTLVAIWKFRKEEF